MESLAQELLDAIIDDIPPLNVQPCSLVAKRWRKRSQQSYFRRLFFASESQVVRWHTNIPQDPNGIPSYPKQVLFRCIPSWDDPTLFNRVLKCFSRVKTLVILETAVTQDNPYNAVLPTEFGRGLTSLHLCSPLCTLPTLISLILSLPNLKELFINGGAKVESVVPIPPDAIWRREALELLELSNVPNDVMDSIARCGITSRGLSVSAGDVAMKRVLANSSETLVELILQGTRNPGFQNAQVILTSSPDAYPPLGPSYTVSPTPRLPPFPALTTIGVGTRSSYPSAHLTSILSCIRSAPALSSVNFSYQNMIEPAAEDIPTSSRWIELDKWLARSAMNAKPEAKGGLVVVLMPWQEDSSWEYLPEFRRSGGELRVDVAVCDKLKLLFK